MQQAAPARAHVVPAAYVPEAAIQITNGPAADNVHGDSAVIWWDTDAKCSSIVHYGTSASDLNQTAEDARQHRHHSIKLSGLKPQTTYYFRVESARSRMETATSDLGVFKTGP